MTVPTTTNTAIGTGNGIATVFPFTFGTLPAGNLQVTLFNLDGVEIPQIENTDYAVLGKGAEDGGSVVFVTAPPAGYTVLIQRIVPETQPDDLKNQGSYYPRSVERMFDRVVMLIQQLSEAISRTLRLPPQVQGVSTELPAPASLNLIGWDVAATGLRNFTAGDIGTTLAFSNFIADRFTAAAAQTNFTLSADPGAIGNLDVSIDGVTQVPTVDYTYLGTTLTFTAPMAGGESVLARYGTALPTGITTSLAVTYQQSGTGAILWNSQSKAREIVSVAEFGADPTGLIDSTNAFINASNRAGANGRVNIAPGTYKLTGANLGRVDTSWVRMGTVTFTGGGTLNGKALERFNGPVRFGVGGEFGQPQMTFNDATDYSKAHLEAYRSGPMGADRAGVMNLFMQNTANSQPCATVFLDADHAGQNTTGFPSTLTAYGTARNLNGANALAATMGIMSPASNIVGETWTAGITYAMELNYGNRWGELGLQRDHTLTKWVGGLVMAADVLPAADGGGTAYNYHAQYGIVFGRGQNGGADRRHWIPILIGSDGIPEGGIGFHARGNSGGNGPLAVIEAALNWQKGVDMSPAVFSAGGPAFKGPSLALTANGSQTEDARIYRSATGRVTIATNRTVADKFTSFMENGNLALASVTPPATATSAGSQGEIAWDSNFFYVCVAANTWKRSALSTW